MIIKIIKILIDFLVNISLFKIIVSKTISNKFVHFIFILLEYFFLFFPSSINITKNIMLMTTELTEVNVSIKHFFNDSLNSQKTFLSSLLPLLLFTIGIILLFLYLYLSLFCKPKHNNGSYTQIGSIIQIAIVNLFDTFSFAIAPLFSLITLSIYSLLHWELGLFNTIS